MLKESFAAIGNSARDLLLAPGTVVLNAVLYFLLLASAYLFVSTGVATILQLILTVFSIVCAFIMMMLLQSTTAAFGNGEGSVFKVLFTGLKSVWKAIFISIV